ncbi:glycoside hydrolase family 16 protein [Paenibacillus sediminis]|uniref:Beta-glucanase (GH16 family) n=1 Tax=Paenibacillus sediminis TaxID=664909 RepID=A0ABS4H2X3_9BACL|nr:glycoside hydrolase family 16 protein [Paenibacillus sediminis]MBP1936475.1 beta-glucanase (GH16 family) [Paenibacillus sediminis]
MTNLLGSLASLWNRRKRNVISRTLLIFTLFLPIFSNVSHPSVVNAAVPGAPSGFTLSFSDDFNGTSGSGINTANWLYDLGTSYPGGAPNWGTGEVETMTNSTSNVYLDGSGHLAIKPIRASNGTWTSGRIESQRTDFQPPAGGIMRVEASIQLPNVTGAGAQGIWPAFWMLGSPFRGVYTNWPSVGEIDIMENINGINTVWGTLHCGTSPGGPCNETSGIGGNRSGFSPSLQAGYHTYAIEYDKSVSPEQIRWYVDGIQYHTVNANQVDAATWSNATNHGFFIILNVAMGGGWPGAPTSSTASGVPMLVDYVAVWTKAGSGGGGGSGGTGSEYSYGVDNVNSSQVKVWFTPSGFTAGYVILHYTQPGQTQQNVYMTYNSSSGRWEYTVNGLTSGQQLSYFYTYQKSGLQYDTGQYTYTKP